MSDRDCKNCIWNTDDGCRKWNCEYVSREEAERIIKESADKVVVLPKEPKQTGDTISRQMAIEALESIGSVDTEADKEFAIEIFEALPSVQEQEWIPVSEGLPEKPFGCLVTVWDTEPMTGEEFENLLPYFVGWDGEQWNDADGEQCPFEVAAWMPLPEPYKGEE